VWRGHQSSADPPLLSFVLTLAATGTTGRKSGNWKAETGWRLQFRISHFQFKIDPVAGRVKFLGRFEYGFRAQRGPGVVADEQCLEFADDFHAWLDKIAPENDPAYTHTLEGPDDTTSHLRMAITRTSEVIPIVGGKLALGTWQGIFVLEHRRAQHTRSVDIVAMGVSSQSDA
jgi:secondary thiamine-phosphate synthase enzyme